MKSTKRLCQDSFWFERNLVDNCKSLDLGFFRKYNVIQVDNKYLLENIVKTNSVGPT